MKSLIYHIIWWSLTTFSTSLTVTNAIIEQIPTPSQVMHHHAMYPQYIPNHDDFVSFDLEREKWKDNDTKCITTQNTPPLDKWSTYHPSWIGRLCSFIILCCIQLRNEYIRKPSAILISILCITLSTLAQNCPNCGPNTSCILTTPYECGYTAIVTTEDVQLESYRSVFGRNASITAKSTTLSGAYAAYYISYITTSHFNILCGGVRSCSYTSLISENEILCSAAQSCSHSALQAKSAVYLDGEQSGIYANISNSSAIYANGAYSLMYGRIDSVGTELYVVLMGYYAGFGAVITCQSVDTCTIMCYGNSCFMLQINCIGCMVDTNYATHTPITNSSQFSPTLSVLEFYDIDSLLNTAEIQCNEANATTYDVYLDSSILINDDNAYMLPVCLRYGDIDGVDVTINTITPGQLLCLGYGICYGLTINTTGSVHCASESACSWALITTTDSVYCSAQYSCHSATIYATNIYCTGVSSCDSATMKSLGYRTNETNTLTVHVLSTNSWATNDINIKCKAGDNCNKINMFCFPEMECDAISMDCEPGSNCNPSFAPTTAPTGTPTKTPTRNPTYPSSAPTYTPTIEPTISPITDSPSAPTTVPTTDPSSAPTTNSSSAPTTDPSSAPTTDPTTDPSSEPTTDPSSAPTTDPTTDPTTISPTTDPSSAPTTEPTIVEPTISPKSESTAGPSSAPTRFLNTWMNIEYKLLNLSADNILVIALHPLDTLTQIIEILEEAYVLAAEEDYKSELQYTMFKINIYKVNEYSFDVAVQQKDSLILDLISSQSDGFHSILLSATIYTANDDENSDKIQFIIKHIAENHDILVKIAEIKLKAIFDNNATQLIVNPNEKTLEFYQEDTQNPSEDVMRTILLWGAVTVFVLIFVGIGIWYGVRRWKQITVSVPLFVNVSIGDYICPSNPEFETEAPITNIPVINDAKNLDVLCKRLNYHIMGSIIDDDFIENEVKVNWTQDEVMQLLRESAKELISYKHVYDALIVIFSCHGYHGNIITSDYKLIDKNAIHRLYSVEFPETRTIPRMFLFDCCEGAQKRQYRRHWSNDSNELLSKNIAVDDIKPKRADTGLWHDDEVNPDFKLIEVHASNVGFQSLMDCNEGSYLLNEFIKSSLSPKEKNLREIFGEIQEALHTAGKQQIKTVFNNGTDCLVLKKNENIETVKAFKRRMQTKEKKEMFETINSLKNKIRQIGEEDRKTDEMKVDHIKHKEKMSVGSNENDNKDDGSFNKGIFPKLFQKRIPLDRDHACSSISLIKKNPKEYQVQTRSASLSLIKVRDPQHNIHFSDMDNNALDTKTKSQF